MSGIPSTLPPGAVMQARVLWSQGLYADAWNILAQAGDRYADNAAGAVGSNRDTADTFFQHLVENHWKNTVSEATYNAKFDEVAGRHLNNYLNSIEQEGLLPDTQTIGEMGSEMGSDST